MGQWRLTRPPRGFLLALMSSPDLPPFFGLRRRQSGQMPNPGPAWARFCASGAGAGYLPLGPGTWGSALGLLLAIGLILLQGKTLLLVALFLLLAASLPILRAIPEIKNWRTDPRWVVIDEIAGLWIALLPARLHPLDLMLAFLLFRLFDICKPRPMPWIEHRFAGALGIMLDDIVAGIYAAIVLLALRPFYSLF